MIKLHGNVHLAPSTSGRCWLIYGRVALGEEQTGIAQESILALCRRFVWHAERDLSETRQQDFDTEPTLAPQDMIARILL
jgi:hypothetical protein